MSGRTRPNVEVRMMGTLVQLGRGFLWLFVSVNAFVP